MNYGVGDTVVCIDSKPVISLSTGLMAGRKYKVKFVNHETGCVALEGELTHTRGRCRDCGDTSPLEHFFTWRFIKLDGLKEETEERNEQKLGA